MAPGTGSGGSASGCIGLVVVERLARLGGGRRLLRVLVRASGLPVAHQRGGAQQADLLARGPPRGVGDRHEHAAGADPVAQSAHVVFAEGAAVGAGRQHEDVVAPQIEPPQRRRRARP